MLKMGIISLFLAFFITQYSYSMEDSDNQIRSEVGDAIVEWISAWAEQMDAGKLAAGPPNLRLLALVYIANNIRNKEQDQQVLDLQLLPADLRELLKILSSVIGAKKFVSDQSLCNALVVPLEKLILIRRLGDHNNSFSFVARIHGISQATMQRIVGITPRDTTLSVGICPSLITVSPDGFYLATANYASHPAYADTDYLNSVALFAAGQEGQLSRAGSYSLPSRSDNPRSIAFSPDGSYLAVVNEGSPRANVVIFNVGAEGTLSGATSYQLPTSSVQPQSIAFSSDGLYLATANGPSNDMTIFSMGKGGVINRLASWPVGSYPQSLAFSPDGSCLAMTHLSSKDMMVFSVGAGGTLRGGASYDMPPDSPGPCSVAFSPSGSYVATIDSSSSAVKIFEVHRGNGQVTLDESGSYALLAGSADPLSFSFSPGGRYLAIINLNSNDITIFEVRRDEVLSRGISYRIDDLEQEQEMGLKKEEESSSKREQEQNLGTFYLLFVLFNQE
jgi:6-phosphogluconolactonase (cycloisomerase 2 family)